MTSVLTRRQRLLLIELKQEGIVLLGSAIQNKFSLRSPIYLDMREKLYRRPDLMWKTGGEFGRKIRAVGRQGTRQVVIGIPDTATPLALSTVLYGWKNRTDPPLEYLLLRKKAKVYGSESPSHIIGGGPRPDCEYNLVDDVMASGLSKWRSIRKLEREGIRISRIVVFLDRQQGGSTLLEREGYRVHSVFKLLDVVDFYLQEGHITPSDHRKIHDFVATRRFEKPLWEKPDGSRPGTPGS